MLAQGKHPSVDAVRVALGNTGSKTTIHKYLKELEEEGSGADGGKASISEALQDLVERLAGQLQDEANARIDAVKEESAAKERQHAETAAALRDELERVRERLVDTQSALEQERERHDSARQALQAERIERTRAEQQVADLKERLAENEAHRKSLEDKHTHAREALEHYRQSVKDQRDQDQRRHEHEIQVLRAELRLDQQTVVVKQDEITKLNQEGARLVAELSHARQAQRDEQERGRRFAARIEALQAIERHCGVLEAQASDRETSMADLRRQLAAATSSAESAAAQLQETQLELARTKAALAAQQEFVTELRAYMDPREKAGSALG